MRATPNPDHPMFAIVNDFQNSLNLHFRSARMVAICRLASVGWSVPELADLYDTTPESISGTLERHASEQHPYPLPLALYRLDIPVETLAPILDVLLPHFHCTFDDLRNHKHSARLVRARIILVRCLLFKAFTLEAIGKCLNRDHTTIIYYDHKFIEASTSALFRYDWACVAKPLGLYSKPLPPCPYDVVRRVITEAFDCDFSALPAILSGKTGRYPEWAVFANRLLHEFYPSTDFEYLGLKFHIFPHFSPLYNSLVSKALALCK